MKSTSEFIAHLESSPDLKKKLSSVQSASDLIRLASDAGFQVNQSTLSQSLRGIAEGELQKRGFPTWATNSLLLGEAVCW
jgi:nitrogen fixation uncharacterized protein